MSLLRPTPTDGLETETSETQYETEQTLLTYAPTPDGSTPPILQKNNHLQWMIRNLMQGFPARYASQDASQPWLMFWTLQGFSVLQAGLDPGNKQRAIDTILTWQHPDGGFGGGPGQSAHLLPTYASVASLAIVGRPGPGGGWDQIDREKMYRFFMSLKQPDGSFLVMHHGEVDTRGIYCLLVVATLLDLLTPELVEGTAAFLASCQTYEGGFSSSSQSYFDASRNLLSTPRPPLGEAHGGYTFCATASWLMIQPFVSQMEEPKPKLNMKNLLRWLTHMQGSEIELGGFRGRTNKLVDGCYSWWVGGAFALLPGFGISIHGHAEESSAHEDTDDSWDDVDDALFNREALQEYIMYAGQHPAGGLRDKPPKSADAYHTLYCLSGLSASQHLVVPSASRGAALAKEWKPANPTSPLPDDLRKTIFTEALSWTEDDGASTYVGGLGNRVNATHPLFNLTITHAEAIMGHFYGQTAPPRNVK